MKSQKDRILQYMKSGKKITPAIAYKKFGCLRLSERIRECIYDIDYEPVKFNHRTIKKGWKRINKRTRVMEYWLE